MYRVIRFSLKSLSRDQGKATILVSRILIIHGTAHRDPKVIWFVSTEPQHDLTITVERANRTVSTSVSFKLIVGPIVNTTEIRRYTRP